MTDTPSYQKPRVLIVDNNAPVRVWIKQQLEDLCRFSEVEDCSSAETIIATQGVDLVLLDNALADGTGLELCKEIHKASAGSPLPVVVMSEGNSDELIREAFEAGAEDFLRKPLVEPEFHARIGRSLKRIKEREQTRTLIDELRLQSEKDPLTNTLNRLGLQSAGSREISKAKRRGEALSLLILDLDHFKEINDTFGHLVGDEIIVSFAKLLMTRLRKYDLLCRYGGDEFIVVLPHTGHEQAWIVSNKLLHTVRDHVFNTKKGDFSVTTSIGMMTFNPGSEPLQGETDLLDDLLSSADAALYRAKEQGRNCVESAQPELGGVR